MRPTIPRSLPTASTLLLALLTVPAAARRRYMANLPNGDARGESTGHSNGRLFGNAFRSAGRTWTKALCQADTDGDGQTNGLELGDPCCLWTQGASTSNILGFATTDISLAGSARSKTSRTMPSCTLSSPPPPPPPP
eukprot:scaffold9977_cov35-Tisochrysis_lutea.AAC.2